MASPLCNLPFPIPELTWEKFDQVKKHLKVSKAECLTIMCHVLGPPPGPLTATWSYYIVASAKIPSIRIYANKCMLIVGSLGHNIFVIYIYIYIIIYIYVYIDVCCFSKPFPQPFAHV